MFRGRAGSLVKIIWHDGIGMSLYAKRLEKGRFIWPSANDGAVSHDSLVHVAYEQLVADAMGAMRHVFAAAGHELSPVAAAAMKTLIEAPAAQPRRPPL